MMHVKEEEISLSAHADSSACPFFLSPHSPTLNVHFQELCECEDTESLMDLWNCVRACCPKVDILHVSLALFSVHLLQLPRF